MKLTDHVFIAFAATLALAVLFLERRRRNQKPSLRPVPEGSQRIDRMNNPDIRETTTMVTDVAYIDADDASEGPYFEQP